jgi:hypothetical protein
MRNTLIALWLELPRPTARAVRLKPRLGHKKALCAVKHTIITAIWHILTTGELYIDLGGDYLRNRDPERTTKRLVGQLERLGHKVTLETLPQTAYNTPQPSPNEFSCQKRPRPRFRQHCPNARVATSIGGVPAPTRRSAPVTSAQPRRDRASIRPQSLH